LKRLLIILSLILATSAYSSAQVSRSVPGNAGEIVVKTYPVPANSFINFELDKTNNNSYTLAVYNFLGRKMYEKQNFSQKTTITLDEYTRGVYIYHLTDGNGRLVKTGKFQVSK
jgi:Secretion system C-terminal sorting domain